jgi:penicillin V acylase-like amidase (Ntn superfamily)
LLDPLEKAAEWVSRYGSVTFNQYGREMPNGGINEAGLVVETLMLPRARNPAPTTGRAVIVAWVQYQLDNSGTVAEVIASDANVRISSGHADADALFRLRPRRHGGGRGIH